MHVRLLPIYAYDVLFQRSTLPRLLRPIELYRTLTVRREGALP
jgi:hypothetical protein